MDIRSNFDNNNYGYSRYVDSNAQFAVSSTSDRVDIYDISIENEINLVYQLQITPLTFAEVLLTSQYLIIRALKYYQSSSSILIYDIQNNDQFPRLVGNYSEDREFYSITYHDNKIAVLGDSPNLIILDISDPSVPTLEVEYSFDRRLRWVSLTTTHVFVSGVDRDGMDVIDISNPSTPVLVDHYGEDVPFYQSTIEGDVLFVTGAGEGIFSFDISDPANLNLLDIHPLEEYVSKIDVEGGNAFVIQSTFPSDNLLIFDVQDPSSIELMQNISLSPDLEAVHITNDIAVFAAYEEGTIMYNVTNIASPTFLAGFDNRGSATRIVVDGSMMYVADKDDGLEIFDITDNTNPVLLSSFYDGGSTEDVVIRENTAYTADGLGGIELLDLSDLADITQIGQNTDGGSSTGLLMIDDTAYVFTHNLEVFDVSDPSNPQFVKSVLDDYFFRDFVLIDDVLYASGYDENYDAIIAVIDVTDPLNPEIISSVRTIENYYGGLDVERDLLVTGGARGIELYDISDIENPSLIGEISDIETSSFALNDNSLVIYESELHQIRLYDISDPSTPNLLTTLELLLNVADLLFEGEIIYVAATYSGIFILEKNDEIISSQLAMSSSEGVSYHLLLTISTLILVPLLRKRYTLKN